MCTKLDLTLKFLLCRCEFASHFVTDTSDLWLSRISVNDSPVSFPTVFTLCTASLITNVEQHDALCGRTYTGDHQISRPSLTHVHITGLRCSEALLEAPLDLRVGMIPVSAPSILGAFRSLKETSFSPLRTFFLSVEYSLPSNKIRPISLPTPCRQTPYHLPPVT